MTCVRVMLIFAAYCHAMPLCCNCLLMQLILKMLAEDDEDDDDAGGGCPTSCEWASDNDDGNAECERNLQSIVIV